MLTPNMEGGIGGLSVNTIKRLIIDLEGTKALELLKIFLKDQIIIQEEVAKKIGVPNDDMWIYLGQITTKLKKINKNSEIGWYYAGDGEKIGINKTVHMVSWFTRKNARKAFKELNKK